LIGQDESDQPESKREEVDDPEAFYERKLREIQQQLDAGEKLTYEDESSAKNSEGLDSQIAKADYMKYLEQLGQVKGKKIVKNISRLIVIMILIKSNIISRWNI